MWRAWLDMNRRLLGELDHELQKDGLSGADYALLVPLSESSEHELRARDLGRTIDWDRSRLSHQIRRMEERGLIERRECDSDGRGTWVRITDSGLTALKAAAPRHVEMVRDYFIDQLTAEELETLTAVATRVLDRLGEPSSDACGTAEGGECQ